MAITGDRLIRGVERRITAPANQNLLQETDILEFGDDVIKEKIIPILIGIREDYFVKVEEVPVVASQEAYPVPYRAVANGLRDFKYRDSQGGFRRNMVLIPLEDEHGPVDISGTPNRFYFRGDEVVLVNPPSSSGGILEFWFEMPPGNITKEDQAARITGISGTDITVNAVPTSMTTGTTVDFVRGRQGGQTFSPFDVPITNVVGNVISFGSVPLDKAGNTKLSVGDYIALAETSPIIQIPEVLFPLLENLVGQRVSLSIGDMEMKRMLSDEVKEVEKDVLRVLEPRIRGEAKKVVNRRGLLRGYRRGRRRGLYY